MRTFRSIILLAFSLSTPLIIFSQSLEQKLSSGFDKYQFEYNFYNLYLHTDKNIYSLGEPIWFKAYLLSGYKQKSSILYVRLTDHDKNLILEKNFPIYDIRSHGNITVPETVASGRYFLYAYTDCMIGNEREVFVQSITIYRNEPNGLKVYLTTPDSTKILKGEKVTINIQVKNRDYPAPKIKGEGRLLLKDSIIQVEQLKTDDDGRCKVSFIYPEIDDSKKLKFEVSFTNKDTTADASLDLKDETVKSEILAFPEGGLFIAGRDNKVVIKIVDRENRPLSTSFIIRDKLRGTIETRTNSLGYGMVHLTPSANSSYTIEIEHNKKKEFQDLKLNVEKTGVQLTLLKVSGQQKALINNSGSPDSVIVALRSFKTLIWTRTIFLKELDSLLLNFPVDDLPKEVLSLALFDREGKLLAERLFQNKPSDDLNLSLNSDKSVYSPRENTSIKLKLTDKDKKPLTSNLSVAVVRRSAVNQDEFLSILDKYYFKYLDVPILLTSGLKTEDIDLVLITKNWWINSWDDITRYIPGSNPTNSLPEAGIFGEIRAKKTKDKLPKIGYLYDNSQLKQLVKIADDGTFFIPASQLLSATGNKQYFKLPHDVQDRYTILINDPSVAFDESIKRSEWSTSSLLNSKGAILEKPVSIGKAINLEAVTVTGRRSTNFSFGNTIYTSTTCNDWVCTAGHLNCPLERGEGTQAKEGQVYKIYKQTGTVTYHCVDKATDDGVLIKGISIPEPFMLPDSMELQLSQPLLRSTALWIPNINTDSSGEALIQFHNSDLTGEFLVIIQGVSTKSITPIYSSFKFSVRKNEE